MPTNYSFEMLKHLVRGLGVALGPKYEVVLHDVSQPESSIVEIVNNDITGRKVGDSSTNLVLPVLKDPFGNHDAFNYRSVTRSGKLLKSSSIYFKDEDGRVFAAVCINHDISELTAATAILRQMVEIDLNEESETFSTNIDDVISKILDDIIRSFSKPVDQMTKEEKLKIIQILDDKGIFAVKRSIDKVAPLLGVSRVTVYGYINEAQAMKGNVTP